MQPEENPYAPPSAPVETQQVSLARQPDAGLWRRFFNYLIDGTAAQLASIPPLIAIEALSPGALESMWIAYGISFGVFFGYYVLGEHWFGLTLGKIATGTRVVGELGDRPPLRSVVLRTAVRCVPFEPLSFYGSRSPRGWHDAWSGTRVVNVRAPASTPSGEVAPSSSLRPRADPAVRASRRRARRRR